MHCFLVQHGEAAPETQDPTRPLTERGREEVGRVPRYAARLGLRAAEIWPSGKPRSLQTAEIFAEHLKPSPILHEQRGLSPGDDPVLMLPRLEAAADPVMLVGHLPHLGRLASLLLVGDSGRVVIQFRNAGIVCLARGEGGWSLHWALPPDLVPGRAGR